MKVLNKERTILLSVLGIGVFALAVDRLFLAPSSNANQAQASEGQPTPSAIDLAKTAITNPTQLIEQISNQPIDSNAVNDQRLSELFQTLTRSNKQTNYRDLTQPSHEWQQLLQQPNQPQKTTSQALTVNAITHGPNVSVANINGDFYQTGDMINQHQILSIDKNTVELLAPNGRKQILSIAR